MFLFVGILVACQPRERVIDYPAFQAKNSASLEISRIVLNGYLCRCRTISRWLGSGGCRDLYLGERAKVFCLEVGRIEVE